MESRSISSSRKDRGFRQLCLTDDVRQLDFAHRFPFVNRPAQSSALVELVNRIENGYCWREQHITIPTIVGLAGIGKTSFARNAILAGRPESDRDLRLRESATQRLQYIRKYHAIVGLDLGRLSDESNETFVTALVALHDECCKNNRNRSATDTTQAESAGAADAYGPNTL